VVADGKGLLSDCRMGVGRSQFGNPFHGTDIHLAQYDGEAPDYCEFLWETTTIGIYPNLVDLPVETPVKFNVSNVTVPFFIGYQYPATLAEDQPHIEFDEVNFRLPGVYNVTYDVSDDFNNTADTVWRTVTVKDTTPPVLHLEGDPIMFVRYGQSFVDPGVNATDTGDDYYYELNRMVVDANNTYNDAMFTLEETGVQLEDALSEVVSTHAICRCM